MYCTWESIDMDNGPRMTHFKSFLLPEEFSPASRPESLSVGIFWRRASKILLAQVVCWRDFYLKNCASKI